MSTTITLAPDQPRPERDFRVIDHGTILTFRPLTAEAQQWWDDHVADGPGWGNARAVEPRMAASIVTGIESAGLTI